jgi:Fe-S-cluster-containing hydrogenase component 2
MIRKIIEIDEEKCDGCGLCVDACHEGAIQMVDKKARLVSDIYCDGLGDCIGECPQGAITIIEREAQDFDEEAVKSHLERLAQVGGVAAPPVHGGCPGSALRSFGGAEPEASPLPTDQPSALSHWPVQIKLVPPMAPFLQERDLLICADCVPFALPDFHGRFLAGKAVLVGCPKLDDLEFYHEKFKAIFAKARPKSVTVLKMEVPCCTGIAHVAVAAAEEAAPDMPVEVITISIQGAVKG